MDSDRNHPLRVEIDKSLRETESYLNDMTPILDELNLEHAPDHTTICRWERKFEIRELQGLLRRSAEQVGWTGVDAVDDSGFQRDQTSYHYRNRTNYSFQSTKTTILVDVETLAIRDVHFTTQKAYDESV